MSLHSSKLKFIVVPVSVGKAEIPKGLAWSNFAFIHGFQSLFSSCLVMSVFIIFYTSLLRLQKKWHSIHCRDLSEVRYC
jgi:hypothetical protein